MVLQPKYKLYQYDICPLQKKTQQRTNNRTFYKYKKTERQISLSEATRIPRFASLSVWSLILFTSDETRQQQHGQQSKTNGKTYCAFHKHANSKVQTPPSQLRFSLPSIIITFTSNEPCNTETCKTDRKPPITNHNP